MDRGRLLVARAAAYSVCNEMLGFHQSAAPSRRVWSSFETGCASSKKALRASGAFFALEGRCCSASAELHTMGVVSFALSVAFAAETLRWRADRLLHNAGHRELYTPPYWPELQPIELLWAAVKGKITCQIMGRRTLSQLVEELHAAFAHYGSVEFIDPLNAQQTSSSSESLLRTTMLSLCDVKHAPGPRPAPPAHDARRSWRARARSR